MTILFQDGFESGDTSKWTGVNQGNAAFASVSNKFANTGIYSLQGYTMGQSTNPGAMVYEILSASHTKLSVRAYFLTDMLPPPGNMLSGIIALQNSSLSQAPTAVLGVERLASGDFVLHLFDWCQGGHFRSNPIPIVANMMYCLELTVVMGVAGEYHCYYQGTEMITVTNWDTTRQGITALNMFSVGMIGQPATYEAPFNMYFDDAAAGDSYVGPLAGHAPPLVVTTTGPYTAPSLRPTINFACNVTGGILPYAYLWNFGDGTTSSLQNPTHTYPKTAQTYNVTLSVTDQQPVTTTVSVTVHITTVVIPPALLHCVGKDILNAQNQKVILSGVAAEMGFSYADPSVQTIRESDPAHFQGDVNVIASWGCNCVRVPFNGTWYANESAYRTLMRQWVDMLAAKGIYTIMDIHMYVHSDGSVGAFPESGYTSGDPALAALLEWAIEVQEGVTADFADQPYMIGVELNEFWPLDDRAANWTWVLNMANTLAQRVHAINPNLLVFFNPAFGEIIDQSVVQAGPALLTEPNIVMGQHMYIDPITYHPWFGGYKNTPTYDDGWDFWKYYGNNDAVTGKMLLYRYLDNYVFPTFELYGIPLSNTEYASQGFNAALVQSVYDIMGYFASKGWGVSYWAYMGGTCTANGCLQLLLTDWTTLTPQGAAFVNALYAQPPGVVYALTLNAAAGGTTNPLPGLYETSVGKTRQVTAIPNSGYTFSYWELDGANVGSTNPYTLTMNANHTLAPVFVGAGVTLTVVAGANGSVNPSGAQVLNVGQAYSFTATPNPGYALDHWDLAGTSLGTSNPLSITATAAMNGETLTAEFVATTVTITVAAGAGGTVSPIGTEVLTIGTVYQFAAIPDSTHVLDHWDLNGRNQGSSNPLSLTAAASMNGQTLTAIFTTIPPVQITLNVATSGNGTVNLANGPHTLNVGDTVTFTATPAANNKFVQWTLDGVIYTTNPANIQITSAMNGLTLTADFVETAITLTVAAGPNGSVTPTGAALLTVAQQYLFEATPNSGYQLDHWDLSGANLGSTNPITITATVAMNLETLTAIFTAIPPVQIKLNLAVIGSGTTNPAPGMQTLNVGTTAQFTAIPAAGQTFVQWTIDGTVYAANPLSLPVNVDMNGKTLTAELTTPPSGPDLATIGAILLGITDIGLMAWGAAHMAGFV